MSQYYNIKTNAGDAAIATALANNTKLNITHVAFGDGGGSVPTPSKNRTTLVHEVHRQAVNKYTQHPTISKWLTVEAIIPSNIGGFWIREIGVIADGVLISYGSHAPFFKVADTEGVSEYRLKFTIDIQDASIVQLTLDESLIYASQAWVNENYVPRADIVNNLTTADATKPLSAAQGKVLQDSKLGKTENAVSATKLQTARTIGGVAFDGTTNIDLPGVNTAGNQNTSGNAATATKLQTARTIGGVSFDGSANIDLPGVNTAGNQNTSGNAATATKLQTARTIGGVSFDGSANINLPGVNTVGNQNTSGNAATATKLNTARKINGVNFDGTADILVPDNWQYIPYGADLNNYTTAGYYFCDQDIVGASVWNSPIALSFSLIVEKTAGIVQRITGYFGANAIEYKRGFYSGEWSEWDKVVSAKHKAETLQNVVTRHGYDEAFILEHNSKNGSGFFFDNGNGKTIEQYSSGFFASHKEGGFFTLGAEPLNGRIKAITGVVRGDNTVDLKKTHTVLTQESTGLSYGLTTGFNTSHIAAMSPMQVADFLAGKSNNGGYCHYLALNGPTSGGSFPDAYGAIEGFSSRDNHYSYSWQRFSAVNGGHQYIRFALNDNTWSEWSSIALTSSNVASATKLQTARTIGGVSFDGTDNINLPGVNTVGNQNTSGNAATATKLSTPRKINNVDFDGTKDINLPLLGVGQTWTNVAASRVVRTTYTNSTGRPIQLFINANFDNGYITLNGDRIFVADAAAWGWLNLIIPDGNTYMIEGSGDQRVLAWWELR
ncbi:MULTISPECIES: phage tail protein [Acinetobacter]|uniref:phage tail-collar fiber domain-containing protein n=1 Tax=Acinetobacter TaxID=469 RepID=UPI001BD95C58|nr:MULTISPECIES: phage tail protein [Acinetobacter]MBT0887561.1 phage tail protein [Acinetobacter towneri]